MLLQQCGTFFEIYGFHDEDDPIFEYYRIMECAPPWWKAKLDEKDVYCCGHNTASIDSTCRKLAREGWHVKILEEIGKDTKATWDSIKKADGSVQHLDFLTDEQKDVFRTFAEINQILLKIYFVIVSHRALWIRKDTWQFTISSFNLFLLRRFTSKAPFFHDFVPCFSPCFSPCPGTAVPGLLL